MSERADRELVELARQGDRAAAGELFSRYWRAARAAAFGVTGEMGGAEDAAAEAFRQALATLDSLRDPDRFGAWLRTIVVRPARAERERLLPAAGTLAADPSDPSDPLDEALERIELAALLQQTVRRLPERLREAVALVYYEGYDAEAAARFLEIPAGTLRRRLHEGRKTLRRDLEQIPKVRERMHNERERQIQALRSAIESGDVYGPLREALALRPPPAELMRLLPASRVAHNGDALDAAQRWLLPSRRASDPNHPVGAIAAAIRNVLPEFQPWTLDASGTPERFLAFAGEHRDRLRLVLPPGFAEGRPGAFVRATRALVRQRDGGEAKSLYEHLRGSTDEAAFRGARDDVRLSDTLELTWMSDGGIEMRSVQTLLERLSAAILTGARSRFSPYDEPRYRCALSLFFDGVPARAALRGVLAEWPGRAPGVEAAHARIYLEAWAWAKSGEPIELDRPRETT